MLSCTEYIPAYSELFKFLHAKDGKQAVVRYWTDYAVHGKTALRDIVAEKGLAGCFEFWNHSLNEEAAEFRITLDEDNGVFTMEMRDCPSKGRLLNETHIEPYEFYCEHCQVLYSTVLEPLGLQYKKDISQCHKARCCVTIVEKNKTSPAGRMPLK